MGVASHLKIELEEYDARIRTFVPYYEQMLSLVADALRPLEVETPTIVDMGVGTGALAARCLAARPKARLVGIDSDPGMLGAARRRLAGWDAVELLTGDFLDTDIPRCDAVVASVALHHVKTPDEKRAFYVKCAQAIKRGGILVSADCFPDRDPRLAAEQRAAWLAHLERTYSAAESEGFLSAWADEDVYFPLQDEMDWLTEAGFQPEVIWRKEGFAVLCAFRMRVPDGRESRGEERR